MTIKLSSNNHKDHDDGYNDAMVITEHTCEDNDETIQILCAKSELKEQVAQNPGHLRAIFDTKKELSGKVAFTGIEPSLYRARRRTMPGVQHSARQAVDTLRDEWENIPKRFTQHVQATIRSDQGGHAVIMWSNETADIILSTGGGSSNNVQRLQADGTFSVCPIHKKAGGFVQLFTILVEFKSTVLPLAYVLMSNRTKQLYSTVLARMLL